MPALKPTDYTGRIAWLGHVADRDAALASAPADEMILTFAGPQGEDHGGLTRPSCSRVLSQYPRGTEIRNTRQLSVVSAEELAQIATELGQEDTFEPTPVGIFFGEQEGQVRDRRRRLAGSDGRDRA